MDKKDGKLKTQLLRLIKLNSCILTSLFFSSLPLFNQLAKINRKILWIGIVDIIR